MADIFVNINTKENNKAEIPVKIPRLIKSINPPCVKHLYNSLLHPFKLNKYKTIDIINNK